ncbi:restriction endonuclease [Ideonella sp. BN130291]|uniref:restriction endonuclease n=1 Tax=Ideonella sp. BN130291 TaxID=3112940 RepID=UPI003FA5423B
MSLSTRSNHGPTQTAFADRSSLHPRLFGYRAEATAYTSDGGIDVVLEDSAGERIGVQVKRQKRSIEVEQIRAFLGALVLGGYARGVFVSSSRFSQASTGAARKSTESVLPIDLVDADRFFDMLGYAQLHRPARLEDCDISRAMPLKFHGHACYNLKTL